MTRARFSLVMLSLLVAGCGKKKVKTTHGRPVTQPSPAAIGNVEVGIASWYGHPYHGRQAADGEIYDMETLVAAHRTLPFNTWVRVTNLSNSKTVDVRIIDRGPFIDGRIIDLSHAAAGVIDLVGPGIAKVRVEVIGAPKYAARQAAPSQVTPAALVPPQTPGQPAFGVQVGVYAFRVNAEKVMQNMQVRYGSARIIAREGLATTWRVVVGRENSPDDAESLAARIRSTDNLPESFVVRLDP